MDQRIVFATTQTWDRPAAPTHGLAHQDPSVLFKAHAAQLYVAQSRPSYIGDANITIQGQSPQACAAQNGLTVSSDFQVPTAAPLGTNGTSNASPTRAKASATSVANDAQKVNAAGFVGLLLGAAALL
jgi:hypothetical protein